MGSKVMTVYDFTQWMRTANPKSIVVYFQGFNIGDNFLGFEIQKETYKQAVKGNIYLVQRKLAMFDYEYIAIKASGDPHPDLIPFSDEKVREAVRPSSYRLVSKEAYHAIERARYEHRAN